METTALSTAPAGPEIAEIEAALAAALAPLQEETALVGLDVDGTLVDHDGIMSPLVHEVLQESARRHHVVIATGRSLGATLPVVRAAGVERGYAVCSNGAVTLELDPSEEDGYRVLDVRTFRPGSALRALREVAPGAHYAVEMADGRFRATPGFQDSSFGVEAEETELEDLLRLEAVRVVVHVPDLTPEEFGRVIAESGVHGVEYAIGWTAWLDMAAPGVSKASALELVRERLDVEARRTVAVGDGWNDTEMLAWAGVGVAMGQAQAGVVETADLRTADVGRDGAALVLRALLPS
ncbi:HAD family hydrolase [Brachybacterium hainanense]|uniref:HAD family hydrolase n=1 Tax=Brachybacterium hainanense TaxID=1541174 RepID=A0ABV6RG85_9MICO